MRFFRWLLVIVVVVVALGVVQLVRPVPQLVVQAKVAPSSQVTGAQTAMSWPTQGEAALEAVGVGQIGKVGSDTPLPIASVTKVMTAYLVLKKHPLGVGEQGPSITISSQDEQTYKKDKAQGESVLPVKAGETLTERQLLEGLLLPSGNNAAVVLANWTDGSTPAFVQEMNQTAKTLGMTNTHYADPSGFDPASASTAEDQLKVFKAAMGETAFREITGMAQATVPVAGTIYNVDYRLGKGGIVAGKTGSTPQAGGCFVFASYKTVGTKQVMIVGALLGQGGGQPLMTALDGAVTLSEQAQAMLKPVTVVKAGTTAATIDAPWALGEVPIQTPSDVTMIGWNGMTAHDSVSMVKTLKSKVAPGTTVATMKVQLGEQTQTVPLTTTQAIEGPSYTWRLKHI